MGNKGLKSVIMCVLILGIIYEVEGKSCCMSTLARNCYKICRLNFAPAICAITCDCIIIKGKICPRGYPKLNLLPNSSEPNATEYCNLGCVSSVCDTMNNDFPGKEMKIDMESCSDACDRFCNGDSRIASVAA
ncbi:thionin BTH7-like [Panicum virgatum]|uniref:thionin BTH7-like n=1 Tax=Panicum virgatum TaxID=38727 RepID=UPI0019D51435|nr:thionin BTH7-like [Panicum virgatum]